MTDIIYTENSHRLRAGTERGQLWLISHAYTSEWVRGQNQTVLLNLDRYTELLRDAQLDGLAVGGAL